MIVFNTTRQRLRPAVFGAAGLALAGPAAAQGIGDTLSNLFKFGGTTVPQEAPRQSGDAYCPSVGLIEGSAARSRSTSSPANATSSPTARFS